MIGVLSVRLMGLSVGIGDHSMGSDLLPRSLIISSSGEGVGDRYEDGRLTVADQGWLPTLPVIFVTFYFLYSILREMEVF